MKNVVRVLCVLVAACLLNACGGGDADPAAANTPAAAADTTLTLDLGTWDATDWAD